MTALSHATRAELLRLGRWPAAWVMAGAWLVLNITFVYVFPYLSYRGGGGGFGGEGSTADELLAGFSPLAVPVAAVQGTPMFGGAILLTLGALAAGSGYGWGTWKTVYTQARSRFAAVGGMLVALLLTVVAIIAVTFVVDLGIAAALSSVEGQALTMPAVGDALRALGAGVLVLSMWTLAGVAVGTLARGPALAVGLGVVWLLAVENLLRGAAALLDWLQPVTDVLPGTVAGSVVGALGAAPVSEGGTPGVLTTLSGGAATGAAVGYVVAFALLTVVLVRRRDVA